MSPVVAFYLSDLQSGGTEWFALRLARGMAGRGIKPIFLVSSPGGALTSIIQKEFDVHFLGGSGYTPWGVLKTLPTFWRALHRLKPETLISGLPLLNIFAALALRLMRKPPRHVLVEHMRFFSKEAPSLSRFFKQHIKRLGIVLVYPLADSIVAVSRLVLDDLLSLGLPSKKVRLIYNPVVPDDIAELAAQEPPHPWLRNKTTPVFLAIGRLLPVKGFEDLLSAFSKLAATCNARLLIFGEGSERKKLENLVQTLSLSERVQLPGSIDNVFSAMRAADVFVVSSHSEAFGNVVAEALACGTPVVSTDCGGPREILQEGTWGRLVAVGNPERLAKALETTLASPPDSKGLTTRGQLFSVEASTNSYLELLGLTSTPTSS